MAELERGQSPAPTTTSPLTPPTDPHHSTAKRHQRTQAFSSHLAHSLLERQLLGAQAAKSELETTLRQREAYIEQLEGNRRFLAEREEAEWEERERERAGYLADKVRSPTSRVERR